MNDPLAAVLADDALADLTTRPLGDLRSYRWEANRVESDVSMVRRVAQGRLDIIGHEVRRRAGDGDAGPDTPTDVNDLLYDLPEILAEAGAAGPARSGRSVEITEPGETAAVLGAKLDAAISPRELSTIGDLSDDQLVATFQRVQAIEDELSGLRRSLHDRIDAVQQEIGRRYRDGEASIEGLGR